MDAKFSQKIKDVISFSREEAIRLGNEYIGIEHLLLGILRKSDGVAVEILKSLQVNLKEVRTKVEDRIKPINFEHTKINEDIPLLKQTERTLKLINLEAMSLKSQQIDTSHLLLAILKDENSIPSQVLATYNVNYKLLKDIILAKNPMMSADFPEDGDSPTFGSQGGKKPQKPVTKSNSDTPVLDSFGIDITKAAEESRLDPIVGRDMEIERLAQILSRRKKNNPILIGEPGVGKSAIAEGLAIRIYQKKVSRVLFGKRVVTLDLASIVAGTKYRGQFEERMKAILNELAKTPNIILFIDEIHTIVGAGGAAGSLDAANMLKPALARGEIQCIGATTLNEYRTHIEKDGALERRFQKIMVEPTSYEETVEILQNIKERYEDHHNVRYTDEALDACVKLTLRYVSDRHLPDKAIDALDEAGSRVHISNIHVPAKIIKLEESIEKVRTDKVKSVKDQDFEKAVVLRDKEKNILAQLADEKKKWEEEIDKHRQSVTEENVAEVVAMMTGVPAQRIAQTEGTKLVKMGEDLKSKVIGQDEAIGKIVKSIHRNRAGLKDPNRPIGTFIFLGPTGVGKTQLAKMLSNHLFDKQDALIRIDMSEYMEKFAVSRLVGAPPGYIGYEEGGQLTEKVRRKPYSVVLLDEIEKAHPDVFNILLQILDEGMLTDSLGRKIDFKNTIVIMTSNIGSRELKDYGRGVGFDTKAREAGLKTVSNSIITKALTKAFAPEFLNRVDDVVMFNHLTSDDIHKIIDIELLGLYQRIEELSFKFKISAQAKDFIATKGYDIQFGARPLKRAIQKYLEDPISEIIIKSTLKEGDTISIGFDSKKEDIKVKILKAKK